MNQALTCVLFNSKDSLVELVFLNHPVTCIKFLCLVWIYDRGRFNVTKLVKAKQKSILKIILRWSVLLEPRCE